jgi:hypothetical protein
MPEPATKDASVPDWRTLAVTLAKAQDHFCVSHDFHTQCGRCRHLWPCDAVTAGGRAKATVEALNAPKEDHDA